MKAGVTLIVCLPLYLLVSSSVAHGTGLGCVGAGGTSWGSAYRYNHLTGTAGMIRRRLQDNNFDMKAISVTANAQHGRIQIRSLDSKILSGARNLIGASYRGISISYETPNSSTQVPHLATLKPPEPVIRRDRITFGIPPEITSRLRDKK